VYTNIPRVDDVDDVDDTYLLTPWCRVLLEKLTGLKLVKKFPAFHGTRRFITALSSARHLSVSWASPIQSIYPHPTSWRMMMITIIIIITEQYNNNNNNNVALGPISLWIIISSDPSVHYPDFVFVYLQTTILQFVSNFLT